MFLLDTNVITELRLAGTGRADPQVEAWLRQRNVAELHVSVINVFEAEMGVCQLERRDPVQAQALRRSLGKVFLRAFGNRILDITPQIATRAAAMHVPDPRAERDTWIAATAIVHGLIVVTRNVADFSHASVQICNPWDANL